MGIPAIGTAVGGIPDLIKENQTGFLLPEQPEASQVAEAIEAYVSLTEERKREMASAARRLWQEKFDAVANAAAFSAYLENLTSE